MFPANCREYTGAPADCRHKVFPSADGSIRCKGCHLHPDACTCGNRGGGLLARLLGPEAAPGEGR